MNEERAENNGEDPLYRTPFLRKPACEISSVKTERILNVVATVPDDAAAIHS